MDDKIYVVDAESNDLVQMIVNYTRKSAVFYTKVNRILSSDIKTIIFKNDQPIGFLNLVNERVNGALFADMYIDEKYRGKGYASLAFEDLMKKYKENENNENEFILAETKKDNIGANMSLLKLGTLIREKDDINYYLMDKSRVEEFLNSDVYNSFVRRFGLESKVYVKK